MRSVPNLAVLSRISNIALLYGRQPCGIAYFGSIEALAKVPVKGGPRNITSTTIDMALTPVEPDHLSACPFVTAERLAQPVG